MRNKSIPHYYKKKKKNEPPAHSNTDVKLNKSKQMSSEAELLKLLIQLTVGEVSRVHVLGYCNFNLTHILAGQLKLV